MRKFIPTYSHAVIDYILVIVLLIGPFISEFDFSGMAATICFISSGIVALLSILTASEGGLIRIIPMKIHLAIDILLGIFLIASPFILRFSSQTYFFHIFIGIIILGSAIYTRPTVIGSRPPIQPRSSHS